LCFLKLQVLFGYALCVVSCLLLGFSWLLWLAAGHDLESSSGSCCCYMQVYVCWSCDVCWLPSCCIGWLSVVFLPQGCLISLDATGLLQRISLPIARHCLGCAWVRLSPLDHNFCLLFLLGSSAGMVYW